jgi:hypothetical protein
VERGQIAEAARDLLVRLRLGRMAPLDSLGDEILHNDDALPRLWVEIGEKGPGMGQGHFGIDVAIAAHLAQMHVIEPARVLLEAALDDDEFGDARGERRFVTVEPQADLRAGREISCRPPRPCGW